MTSSEIKLDLFVVDEKADAEQLDALTVRLMRDLRELGAESVERSPGEDVPDGAKGDAFTAGALILAVAPAVLPPLVSYLQAWKLRGETRGVKIKTPAGLEIDIPEDLPEDKLMSLVDKLIQIQPEQDELEA